MSRVPSLSYLPYSSRYLSTTAFSTMSLMILTPWPTFRTDQLTGCSNRQFRATAVSEFFVRRFLYMPQPALLDRQIDK